MSIAFRTRPDICWAVTRVSHAVKTGESEHELEGKSENPNQTHFTIPGNDMELVFDHKAAQTCT
eukprot:12917205-Prorocentrum_lima.AAC.1